MSFVTAALVSITVSHQFEPRGTEDVAIFTDKPPVAVDLVGKFVVAAPSQLSPSTPLHPG